MARRIRPQRTGRNYAVAAPRRVRELAALAERPPQRSSVEQARQASARHGLPMPDDLTCELGVQCHVVAMTRLVDTMAYLACQPRVTLKQEAA